MNERFRPVVRTFVTGLLAALPLFGTLTLVVWVFRLLFGWVGPDSLVGQLLVAIGLGGYLIGVLIVLATIFGLGLLVENGLQRGLARLVHGVLERIPVVGKVYDLLRRMVELFAQSEGEGLKSMSPVWCHFGGVGGAAALALLGNSEPVEIGGQRYLAVLVPTAPVPIGGGLLYVPESWVTPADIGVDGVTSIYVSMGVTSSQYLGKGKSAPRAPEIRPPAA